MNEEARAAFPSPTAGGSAVPPPTPAPLAAFAAPSAAPGLPAPPYISAGAVVYALNHPTRLTAVRALAGGAHLSITQLAALADQPADQVAKHLKYLRDVGILVAARRLGDTRHWDHTVNPGYRATDAAGRPVLDFGGMAMRVE